MKKLIALALLLASLSANSSIVVLDFEGVVPDNNNTGALGYYYEDGFLLTTPQGYGVILGQGYDGSDYTSTFAWLVPNEQPVLTHESDKSFSLLSLEVGALYEENFPQYITVVGNPISGSILTAELLIGGDSMQEYSFGSEWSSLVDLTFSSSGSGTSLGLLDNIKLNVVPIPAAVWLFASGLGLLGWLKRRGHS